MTIPIVWPPRLEMWAFTNPAGYDRILAAEVETQRDPQGILNPRGLPQPLWRTAA
jgi:hypothetical protein